MYQRIFAPPENQSYFLLGPRGTGKTSFVRSFYKDALVFDLLDNELYRSFLAYPSRLSERISSDYSGPIIIDEIQKVPDLLDEVHKLIEERKLHFVLTGSSARKLKSKDANLLGGRAFRYAMYPLTVKELGKDFNLKRSLQFGHLPPVFGSRNSKKFLESYIKVYLQEEIQQESLTRNLPNFSRFLEVASFSQAAPLVISNVARDCSVERKVVENYFSILRDTLLSYEIPIFAKRAKRQLIKKSKFYFFDVGVFRTLRPKGPLDSSEELGGVCLETLVLQELIAMCKLQELAYDIFYWRTQNHIEVDFVLYGEQGFKAVEVKASNRIRKADLNGISQFKKDYPMCDALLLYLGEKEYTENDIRIINAENFLVNIERFI